MSLVSCVYCGYQAKTLVRHLITAMPPHPGMDEYRTLYPDARLVSESVEELRADTLARRGLKRGRRPGFVCDAASEKVAATKEARYGHAGYNNPDKRRRTLLERYGVDNPMHVQEIKDRARDNKIILKEDAPPILSRSDMEGRFLSGKNVTQIAEEMSVAPWAIRKLAKEYGLTVPVIRKEMVRQTPAESIRQYFIKCHSMGRVLPFTEYGTLSGFRYYSRMMRLFGEKAPYRRFVEDLKAVALTPELWDGFIAKIG